VADNYSGRFFRPCGSLKYSFEFWVLVIRICFEFLPSIALATEGGASDFEFDRLFALFLLLFTLIITPVILKLTQVVLELTNVVHPKTQS
jgi:hypothetical protein